MPEFYTLAKLLEKKKTTHVATMLHVNSRDSLRKALSSMIEHDFSQMPVIDPKSNRVVGVISFSSIARTIHHISDPALSNKAAVDLARLKVEDCIEEAQNFSTTEDIFKLFETFADRSYVLVNTADNNVEVLTNFDVIHLFRELAEHFLYIASFESELRSLITRILGKQAALSEAIDNAFSYREREIGKGPPKPTSLDEMTLDDYAQLITNGKNWPKFRAVFSDRDAADKRLEKLRVLRNDLFHFRLYSLTSEQRDFLKSSLVWVKSAGTT